MYSGWHQVAFERDLISQITPVNVGNYALMLIKKNNKLEAYDSTCPHLGANLAFGGVLSDDTAIICPFHSIPIKLGLDLSPYCVKKHQTICLNGLVFVFFGEDSNTSKAFNSFITNLAKDVTFIPGVNLKLSVEYTAVIENGFDANHFKPVHGTLNNLLLKTEEHTSTCLKLSGTLLFPNTPWYGHVDESNVIEVRYYPHAFSPGIICSLMAGSAPYWVITSALPGIDGGCEVWLSIGVYKDKKGELPNENMTKYMIGQMVKGLNKDMEIWENLSKNRPFNPVSGDNGVVLFREFCSQLAKWST
jgi:nitrite reductase/ring-hydroxylating ferredoxin subunit